MQSELMAQLDFYRQKVSQQEAERVEWQQQADQMRSQIESIHRCESDSLATKEQIAELQKALSDSHLSIYDEKSQHLQLKRDYELMLEQDRADKKRLAEVSQMEAEIARLRVDDENNPLKNFKDVRPKALAKEAIKKGQKVPLKPA